MKKTLIVSPYLDHLGGGERYMLSAAKAMEDLGHEIYFAWDNRDEINNLATMLGITLHRIQLDVTAKNLYHSRNPLAMFMATRLYDCVIYLSDGSLPLLGGKKNIVHMQVPFHDVNGRSLKNKLKKISLSTVIVNSVFTKNIVDSEYGINAQVIYPPVVPINAKAHKHNVILSVGRFEPSLNAKKQDVLIEAFKQLSPELPDWKLVLAGASASADWVAQLRKRGEGWPIEFAVNVSHDALRDLYSQAHIYWHAAGYGIDEKKNPELTEHFGITTVEAISAGCIPLVVPYGGQKEIVTNPALHWESTAELRDKTVAVIEEKVLNLLDGIDISNYTYDNFAANLRRLVQ